MKILLHIGQSKTGTSAIQAYLTLNRQQLLESGILYPVVTISGMPIEVGNHNPLADSLVGLMRYPYLTSDQYMDTFFAQAKTSQAKLMILSAEHFIGGEPRVWDVPDEATYFELYRRKINNLAPYFAGHQITILVYLRPQIDWLCSTISQTIRIEKLFRNEPIYKSDRQFFELVKPMLRYNTIMEHWVAGLKPEKIRVVSYERKNLHHNSSIADFLLQAEVGNVEFAYGNEDLEVNQSIARRFIEVKKQLNLKTENEIHERVIIACLGKLTEASNDTTPYLISEDLAKEVAEFVSSENEKLNQKYVEGAKLTARTENLKTHTGSSISQSEIDVAMSAFRAEYRRPKYRLLHLSIALRQLLRNNALPVHSALHQLKRLYWRLRFKN